MRLLILGGTRFLGRGVALEALALGLDVTCAARGTDGPPPAGARFAAVDRDRPDGLATLAGERFDAVVDVSRHPGQVGRAIRALRATARHWTFVSTTSVYVDTATPGQTAATAPLLQRTAPEVEWSDARNYGAAKVACEHAVGEDAFICRPGLIVGPGDPTGRFGYWMSRLARGGEVLVPERPDDPVQLIDVRDLARWIVHAAQTCLVGPFDAIAPSCTRAEFLARCTDAFESSCRFTWVDEAFLERRGIRTGSGPRSLPYPMPDTVGDNSRDVSPALAAGLVVRPLSDTALDTLRWLEAENGPVAGLTAAEEKETLDAWHAEQA